MFDKVLFTDQLYEFSECAHLTSSQGTTIPIEGNISPIIGKNADRLGVVLVFRDVTLIKQRQAEIEYASYHDPLTGIYNYRYYEKQIKLLKTEENLPISIIMGDINGLKLINDSLGHAVGDELLIRAAQVIKSTCRPSDVVVRIGGDEFVILLPKTETHEVEKIVKDIKEAIKQETIESISLSISLGYETITSVDEDAQLTLTRAENHMYRHKISENLSPRSKTIDIIMNSLFEKNPREMAHSQRVSDLSVALATALGWSEDKINELRTSALMHDIGKIGIAESILNKPGKLNDEEWKTIMSHPEIGFRILNTGNEFSEIARYVLEHHEKWNGSGYPRGLKGEAISIQGRILAIADAFDAITSVRTYRATRTTNEAIEELRKYAGIQFDPGLVDFFIEHVLSLRQFSKL
jgi:diguanylate cyclase (GGDEF)-like protein